MIIFFVERGGKTMSKTKLGRLLYFADFGHYSQHHRSISGSVYRKYPLGPASEDALHMLNDLVEDGTLIEHRTPQGGISYTINPAPPPPSPAPPIGY